jgi:NAD(P)-dependent dehydrogenase (short-subunit alcohol dehydrogenase family)
MKTDLIVELLKKEGSHIEENWVKDIPMGRLGHPSELQGTVVWMASDASSYLNGSDIVSNPVLLHVDYFCEVCSEI